MTSYRPRRPSEGALHDVGPLRLHVTAWGDRAAPPLLLLHGSRDAGPTFQFLVDALTREWWVLAPDWRGHGRSGWATDGYAFHNYLADLDALLPRLVGGRPVPLVGHSLGGNVATIYAGLRPERVARLVSLDGFGLPDRAPGDAPAHLRRWLDGLAAPPAARAYPDLAAMAARLVRANPRLDIARALFLAEALSRPVEGGLAFAHDPRHGGPFPVLHRVAEWEACARAIAAPVLWIGSGHPFPPMLETGPTPLAHRVALARAEFHALAGTGHNLHHDAPERVAALIEDFCAPAR